MLVLICLYMSSINSMVMKCHKQLRRTWSMKLKPGNRLMANRSCNKTIRRLFQNTSLKRKAQRESQGSLQNKLVSTTCVAACEYYYYFAPLPER